MFKTYDSVIPRPLPSYAKETTLKSTIDSFVQETVKGSLTVNHLIT